MPETWFLLSGFFSENKLKGLPKKLSKNAFDMKGRRNRNE